MPTLTDGEPPPPELVEQLLHDLRQGSQEGDRSVASVLSLGNRSDHSCAPVVWESTLRPGFVDEVEDPGGDVRWSFLVELIRESVFSRSRLLGRFEDIQELSG